MNILVTGGAGYIGRPGDPAVLVASSEKIKRALGWKPQFTELERIIESAWMWHKEPPRGF